MLLAEKADAHAFDELIAALRQWRRARDYFGPRADALDRVERELLDALNAWEAGR